MVYVSTLWTAPKYEITNSNPGSIPDQSMFKQGLSFVCVQNPDKEIRTKKYGVWIKSKSISDHSMSKQRLRFVFVRFHFELWLLKCLQIDIKFKRGTFIRQLLNLWFSFSIKKWSSNSRSNHELNRFKRTSKIDFET